MPRFTPATEAALLAAGWFEGRTVPDEMMNDWLVINWFPHYTAPQGYTKISPQAWRVLKEFGGLSIERADHENKPTNPFVMNPLLVPDCDAYNSGLESYVWKIGASLFPLGTIEFDIKSSSAHSKPLAIAICDDGRVFSLDYRCRFLGNNIEEALEKIVEDAIDEEEPFDYDNQPDEAEEERTYKLMKTIEGRIYQRELQLSLGGWPDQPTTLNQTNGGDFFAITDWGAEAALMMRAFGVTEECQFFGPHKMKMLLLKDHPHDDEKGEIPIGDFWLRVIYNTDSRLFQLRDADRSLVIAARLLWNGDLYTRNKRERAAEQLMAKGLFNLGLLTPEIEEKLRLTLTLHEKLEWQMEWEKSEGS